MSPSTERYERPSAIAVLANKLMGTLAAWGFAPSYLVQLTVRGRKSGKLYSTPVNLLVFEGSEYLVAPRGTTSWVRNARAVGEVTLTQRRNRQTVRLEEVAAPAKPQILKAYLEQYKSAVQRYFAVQAGAEVTEFVPIVDDHPVFRVIRPAA